MTAHEARKRALLNDKERSLIPMLEQQIEDAVSRGLFGLIFKFSYLYDFEEVENYLNKNGFSFLCERNETNYIFKITW